MPCASQSFHATVDKHIHIQPSLQLTIATSLMPSTFGTQMLLHSSGIPIFPPTLVSVLSQDRFLYFFFCAVYNVLLYFYTTFNIRYKDLVRRQHVLTGAGAEVSNTQFITRVCNSSQLKCQCMLTILHFELVTAKTWRLQETTPS